MAGVKSTVCSSTATALPSVALTGLPPRRAARSKVKTTSLAVKGVPSWKVTPLRRWKRQVALLLTSSQRSASMGLSW